MTEKTPTSTAGAHWKDEELLPLIKIWRKRFLGRLKIQEKETRVWVDPAEVGSPRDPPRRKPN